MPVSGPAKWHGGKCYFASKFWDVALSTDWRPIHVVEPYAGGAAFTLEGLARDLPFSFVINDIDRELTTFWAVLQNPLLFEHFRRHVEAVPFSEVEFNDACKPLCPESEYESYGGVTVARAARFFIRNRQSLAGRMKGFTGVTKTRVRRRMNNEVSAWLSVVDGLPEFHRLLRKVLILDARDAVEVIGAHDGPQTLVYADPPYLHETRATTGEYGEHEMTPEQHAMLLRQLDRMKGKFLLSGYDSELYRTFEREHRWKRVEFDTPNHAAGGKTKRRMREVLWNNL